MIWIAAGLIFVVPFVDPRRPFRWLHVDLVVLVAFGALLVHIFEAGGGIWLYRAAVVSVAAGLLYVLVRMLTRGFKPRRERELLVPLLPTRWLAIAAVAMALFHVAYVTRGSKPVIDVGRVSVVGADKIIRGEGIYDGSFSKEDPNGNTYGPANYLLYVPFEEVFPSAGTGDQMAAAARAAALTFDLLTGIALYLLGLRLRPGGNGKPLGVALAFAWFSYPYTLFVAAYSFNDALVALLLVLALMAVTRPALSGATSAVATAVKFAPAVVVPLLATGPTRRLKSLALFFAAFAAMALALFLPFIPDGGIRELYDRTVGWQATRPPAGSIWALSSHLHPAQVAIRVLAVGLSILVAVVPARKSSAQLAALAAGTLVAVQLGLSYWIPSYVVWFAPLAFLAIFLPYATTEEQASTPATAKDSMQLTERGSSHQGGA